MSRPREYDKRLSTAIRFDPETHARLTAAARERDLSINWLVERAVRHYLDRLVPVDEMVLIREDR